MDLDSLDLQHQLDTQNMMGHLLSLPDQLSQAWQQAQELPLPANTEFSKMIICGMGGSAISGDLISAYAAPMCSLPIYVCRDYDLPAWAQGPDTLVIGSSHSGNTEETLSTFAQAQQYGCTSLAICTGGKLAQMAQDAKSPVWKFEHHGQPRSATGFSFGYLLALLARLKFITDPSAWLESAVQAMKSQITQIAPEVPLSQNPAKQMASRLMGCWVTIIASDALAPVSRRWKGQINELAKAWAQFDILPETDHNSLAGVIHPANHLEKMVTIFLRSNSDHPRNRLRSDLTRQGFAEQGIRTEVYDAQGEHSLAHIWTALSFGDFLSFYLGIAYREDPTPIHVIQNLKIAMQKG